MRPRTADLVIYPFGLDRQVKASGNDFAKTMKIMGKLCVCSGERAQDILTGELIDWVDLRICSILCYSADMFSREKAIPVFEERFHHEGRGPELQRIIWGGRGAQVLQAIEYYNPEDEFTPERLKWVRFVHPEAFAMASEEVHGTIHHTAGSSAAIHKIENSKWKDSLQPRHLENCAHFQLMFYDEIIDVVCQSLEFGNGRFELRNNPDAGPAAKM